MMPTRLFELLAGATVFLIERNYNTLISLQNLKINYHLKKKICNFGSYLGVLILILSIIIFDNENRHPSFFTLFHVLVMFYIIPDDSRDFQKFSFSEPRRDHFETFSGKFRNQIQLKFQSDHRKLKLNT